MTKIVSMQLALSSGKRYYPWLAHSAGSAYDRKHYIIIPRSFPLGRSGKAVAAPQAPEVYPLRSHDVRYPRIAEVKLRHAKIDEQTVQDIPKNPFSECSLLQWQSHGTAQHLLDLISTSAGEISCPPRCLRREASVADFHCFLPCVKLCHIFLLFWDFRESQLQHYIMTGASRFGTSLLHQSEWIVFPFPGLVADDKRHCTGGALLKGIRTIVKVKNRSWCHRNLELSSSLLRMPYKQKHHRSCETTFSSTTNTQ